jgi:hypothetical protein
VPLSLGADQIKPNAISAATDAFHQYGGIPMSEGSFRLGVFGLLLVFVVGALGIGVGHLVIASGAAENGRYRQYDFRSSIMFTPDGKASAWYRSGKLDTRTGMVSDLGQAYTYSQNWPEELRVKQ